MSIAPDTDTTTTTTTDLKTLIAETQAAFRADPDKAKATFASASGLIEGFQTKARLRDHEITIDEPEALGGTDTGPNPVELILAALGTCQEITYRAYATALDIPLEDVRVELEGDIDLRGFFAVDDTVRPGYNGIRGIVHLTTSATPEQIATLRRVVNGHCPVLDILTKPVPTELTVVFKTQNAAAA